MLGLQMATDPRWVRIVEKNIAEILIDHAYCEQKAASNAISLIVAYPQYPDLVEAMTAICQEEMAHFQMVHDLIIRRGFQLGREKKDHYVNLLYGFMRNGVTPAEYLVDRLLFAAMVEARSCERFKVLSENIDDLELASFYHDLMVSEANHYTLFIGLARKYASGMDVDARWQEWLDYEGEIIRGFGKSETVHG